MPKINLVRITTVPISFEKLLEGQLRFMSKYFNVSAVSSGSNRLKEYGNKEGVATFCVPLTRKITPFQDIKATWMLYNKLRQLKPSIVHTHTPKAGIVGMLAAYFAGVPHRLHTVAGLPLMEAKGVKRIILNKVEQLTYRLATKVYPNSFGLKSFILEENFTKEHKVKVIGNGSSNGIDTTYFTPSLFKEDELLALKENIGISVNDFVFIFVGRIVTDKGINELVEAFINLAMKYKEISLLLVGPLEAELDPLLPKTLKSINEHSKIFTTGYVSDVRSYLALSDILVFPSYREGFPNVVMQAGAMGLPSIVTNINGCNEIIEHEVNGLIIPKKNIKALEIAMQTSFSFTKTYQRMVENARPKIENRFERNKFWKLLLQEYNTIANIE